MSYHLTEINIKLDGEKTFALAEFKLTSSSFSFGYLMFNTRPLGKSYSNTPVSVPGVWGNIMKHIPGYSEFELVLLSVMEYY